MRDQAAIEVVPVIVGGVIVAIVALAGILYAIDFEVEAVVRETRCDARQVKVETRQLGIDHTVRDVPADVCGMLEPGNYVEYRVRSQRTTLYESEGGDCLYDSKTGPYCGERRGLLGAAPP